MRLCGGCCIEKAVGEFHRDKNKRDGIGSRCKDCSCAAARAWRRANPQRLKAATDSWHKNNRDRDMANRRSWARTERGQLNGRRSHLRAKYDMSVAEWDALMAAQRGLCALCGDAMVRPVVDHDHDTGAVRGLLHHRCNVALGTVERIGAEFFAAYLQRHVALG